MRTCFQEAGLYPYNVESFSCYLAASQVGRETFSSGSRGFWNFRNTLQLSQDIYRSCRKVLLPKPKCIVYTNLACDANLLTFHRLAEFFDIPVFSIDIPSAQTPANVSYVATQLRALVPFLEKVTGRTIDESKLKERLARSRRTLQNYDKFQSARADKYIPSDLVSPLYSGMTNNISSWNRGRRTLYTKTSRRCQQSPLQKRQTYLLDAHDPVLVTGGERCTAFERGSTDCRM